MSPSAVPSAVELTRHVLTHGPVTRAELGRRLGLSPASLTRLAKPLVARGLLVEKEGPPGERLGRPAKPLDIRPEAGRFLGVKLTGDVASVVVTDLRANVLTQRVHPLPTRRPAGVVDLVAQLVADQGAVLAPPSPNGLVGVGVCLGGKVEGGRVVTRAPFLAWRDVPLADLLEQATGLDVVVENDVVALAAAQHWFGPGRDVEGFSIITTGAGVGWGLVANGAVINTPDTGLGLGGHIPLNPNGPPCPLGQGHRGCAAAMLSEPAMCSRAEAGLGRLVTYSELLAAAAQHSEPAAVQIVDDAARALGRFVALAANLTMYPTVVLGGEGIGLWDVASETVMAVAAAERDPEATALRVEIDASGFTSWARGAASLAIQHAIATLG